MCCLFLSMLFWTILFFFSSRRRHTRSDRDWSSDVCSSDLARGPDPCERGDRAVSFGAASMWGTLERVLVRPPLPEDAPAWRDYGWRSAPDPIAAAAEHEAFRALLE